MIQGIAFKAFLVVFFGKESIYGSRDSSMGPDYSTEEMSVYIFWPIRYMCITFHLHCIHINWVVKCWDDCSIDLTWFIWEILWYYRWCSWCEWLYWCILWYHQWCSWFRIICALFALLCWGWSINFLLCNLWYDIFIFSKDELLRLYLVYHF